METFIIAAVLCVGFDCNEIRLSPNKSFQTQQECEDWPISLQISAPTSVKIKCVTLGEWESKHPPQNSPHPEKS